MSATPVAPVQTEDRSKEAIAVADKISQSHDVLREECSASTIYYDYMTGEPCDAHADLSIALSARESYTIIDVLDKMIEVWSAKTSRPQG